MTIRVTLLTTVSIAISSAFAIPAHAQDVLPRPEQSFKGHIGRTVGESGLRTRYGVSVLAVKRLTKEGLERRFVPAANTSFAALREEQLDRLGDLIEEHADTDALLRLIESGAPQGLPFIPPGAPA